MEVCFIFPFIKDLIVGIIASLIASIITTYVFQFIQLGKDLKLKEFSNIIINYKFFIYWGLLLIFFIMIRRFIFKKIEESQTPYPMVRSILSSYDIEGEAESYGFKWTVLVNVTSRNPKSNKILGVNVGRVNGPYCKDDYREMKVSRTYFGGYKYKCPKCGYKRILLKNSWTLKCEIGDEIEAKYRLNRDNSSTSI